MGVGLNKRELKENLKVLERQSLLSFQKGGVCSMDTLLQTLEGL